MTVRRFEVVIAGGGLVGATLALALATEGVEVALVEAVAPGDPVDPRASLVAAGAWRMWRALGVAEALRSDAQPILGLRVEHGSSASSFAADELAEDEGREPGEPLGWMVENAKAATALAHALEGAVVERVAPARAVDLMSDGREVRLQLADGRTLAAAVAVGAEGRRSVIRDTAGIGLVTREYGQSAVTATLALGRAHAGVARQLFDPAGPLAVLPLIGERASLVWSVDAAAAAALLALPVAAFEAHLNRRLAASVGPVGLIGDRRSFPLVAAQSESPTARRVALVGEAAHSLHPVAGQGLNLGLKDVAALAEVLIEARRLGEDLGGPAVLARYARWRRLDALTTRAGVGAAARLFASGAPPLRVLARAALAATAAMPAARRGFMREAGATAGDPPRLLQGLRV